MTTHQCYKCNKAFSQKSHLDAHLNKKNNCEKCNVNFTTQYAYINEKLTLVSDYINTKRDKKDKIRCVRGHELVCVNGNVNKPHFRHKNSDDVGGEPMTKWHCDWQGNFPVTEVDFKKQDQSQYKDRRADILIEGRDIIIEIQHSPIDDANVICRAHDYKLHDKDLIWIIDGNSEDVKLEKLSDGSYLITFHNNWKYKSFSHTYEFVLLDIQEQIFKIPVRKVCHNMIQVKEYKPIDFVVQELLSDPKNIFDIWEDDNEVKAKLTFLQKGAGNGKTYTIWESISLNFDKEVYVLLVKQHSAKEVIKAELDDQAERNEFHIVNNIEDIEHETYGRQYIANYRHKHSNRSCTVVIGTIDSFIFALSSTSTTNVNFFNGLLENISLNGCDKINNSSGSIRYGGRHLKLNKHAQIWIDETQDLPEIYLHAFIKIILSTKIDLVVVGDKLQSLEFADNFMNCINKDRQLPNIDIEFEPQVNVNRRIKVKHMAGKINSLVNFKKYGVPEISMENENNREDRGENVLEIISAPTVYQNDPDKKKIFCYLDVIIEKVDKEVVEHGYGPKDFLFTFPIMKGNNIATELATRLTEYWIRKLHDDSDKEYRQYVVLHRHEEGQIIDTSSSINSTRIMSIRAAKGDGRHVVFVLGCTEAAIKLCSKQQINIVYESHLHVALTRAKSKIYFGLEKNNDDIHKRFAETGHAAYIPNIKMHIQIPRLLANIDTEKVILLLKERGISELKEEPDKNTTAAATIDWEYHCIRHAIYIQYARFKVLEKSKDNSNFQTSQIKFVLDKISKLSVQERTTSEFYAYLTLIKKNNDSDFFPYFPLCNLSHKSIYNQFFTKIKDIMEKIQLDYKKNRFSLGEQTPLEAVIQYYMIDLFKNKTYHTTPPTTIYNIISFFESCNGKPKETDLLEEAENMKGIVSKVIDDIYEENHDADILWNIEHWVNYRGMTHDLGIAYTTPIIGYDDKNVYHLMFKTDYNQLNHWDTMIEILLERFLIRNPTENEFEKNNKTRFGGKNIKTYLFILKQNRYKLFDWDWDNLLDKDLKEECKKAIVKDLSGFSKQIYDFYTFTKKADTWKGLFNSPMEYIVNEKNIKLPTYAIDFFKDLHQQILSGKRNEVIELTNTEKMFCDSLNLRIEQTCDRFFGIIIDNADNIEW
jgi:hypothetical protein